MLPWLLISLIISGLRTGSANSNEILAPAATQSWGRLLPAAHHKLHTYGGFP